MTKPALSREDERRLSGLLWQLRAFAKAEAFADNFMSAHNDTNAIHREINKLLGLTDEEAP